MVNNFLVRPTGKLPGQTEILGAFHLVKISGISGSAVNGTRFVGSSHWKIPRKSTTKWNNFLPIGNSTFATTKFPGFFRKWKAPSEKVVPLSRLGGSEWKFVYHLDY